MSRAFVKEPEDVEGLPDRPISDLPNDVTAEGLRRIEQALAAAQAAAQSTRDREALASARRDFRYWNARRATARVAPEPSDNSVVRFGHTVTIVREDDRRQTFRIVGEDEAEPAHGTISHASPLARALFGKGVGEVAVIAGGEAEIVEIR
ncbi:transcription elongation factor GreA [Bradyrhizobium icense]|uniref:Transcription elongation factor n=1 Tax=Bradyrhizobium icense TaxID=1274631 RepID=A0A1B1UFU4_9BRAD|nr:transcription elongation factor GreA [Bradyrhizobium icense]ANW01596.1 transcription elongation factor [Bradyrhizobium icense]